MERTTSKLLWLWLLCTVYPRPSGNPIYLNTIIFLYTAPCNKEHLMTTTEWSPTLMCYIGLCGPMPLPNYLSIYLLIQLWWLWSAIKVTAPAMMSYNSGHKLHGSQSYIGYIVLCGLVTISWWWALTKSYGRVWEYRNETKSSCAGDQRKWITHEQPNMRSQAWRSGFSKTV